MKRRTFLKTSLLATTASLPVATIACQGMIGPSNAVLLPMHLWDLRPRETFLKTDYGITDCARLDLEQDVNWPNQPNPSSPIFVGGVYKHANTRARSREGIGKVFIHLDSLVPQRHSPIALTLFIEIIAPESNDLIGRFKLAHFSLLHPEISEINTRFLNFSPSWAFVLVHSYIDPINGNWLAPHAVSSNTVEPFYPCRDAPFAITPEEYYESERYLIEHTHGYEPL